MQPVVQTAAKPQPPRNLTRKLLLSLCSLLFSLALAEVALRLVFHDKFLPARDEQTLLYRFDETLGWFPRENNVARVVSPNRTITVTDNSDGFRGPERITNDKPGILFLGDSFVWGYEAEAGERFTEKLQAKHPEWNIYNLGVSGYGNDQEFILLQKYFDLYKPRVVILIYCTDNDFEDNATNTRHGNYKPYCKLVGNDSLEVRGIPVPRSEKAILAAHPVLSHLYLFQACVRAYARANAPPLIEIPIQQNPTRSILQNMRRYASSRGAFFGVGIQDGRHAPQLLEFLKQSGISYVDLTTTNKYPGLGGHWTPEGHLYVSQMLDNFLMGAKAQKLLPF